jgi:DNA-binding protein HU-beta
MSTTLTKNQLIDKLAASDESLSKSGAKKTVDSFFELMAGELALGNRVNVNGFGTFEVKNRAARQGRNPQTGEPMQIAASKSVRYKISADMKRKING